MNSNKKHYIIYKTTNLLNNKIYIGQHQTNNLDDGYFGSGYNIKKAVAKHGIQNFDTCVLFNFDSFEEMNNKEIELVNEAFIKREDTYNLVIGGTIDNTNMIVVVNNYGNKFRISKDDPRYISGELVTITNSNKFRTPYGDFNSGKHFCTWCIDNKGITFNVSTVNAMLSRRNKKFKFKSIILDSLNIIDYKGKTARDLGWYLLINN